MGIPGLKTFLMNNQNQLASRKNVHSTHLVVDANNILSTIYDLIARDGQDYQDHVYGGNLVKYGQVVREFFANLIKCKITAVLVFDGSSIDKSKPPDSVDLKERQLRFRGQRKFHYCARLGEFPPYYDYYVAKSECIGYVFRLIAVEFGVQMIQTPHDADAHMVRVANQLQCPVLTNDTDFLIHDLEKGFLMFDLFEFDQPSVDGQDNHCIEGALFSQTKLLNSMPGLRREVLPLLGISAHNDHAVVAIFKQFMQNPMFNRPYEGQYHEPGNIMETQLVNLLTWLEGKSLTEAIQCVRREVLIFAFVEPKYFYRELDKILSKYRVEREKDLVEILELIYSSERLDSPEYQSPAKFLKQRMECDHLDSFILLDMIFKNTHYYFRDIDDFSLTPSSYVKYRTFSLALVLLRANSYENLTVDERREQAQRDAFFHHDRLFGQYTELPIKPMATLEGFGSLDHLDCYSMIALDMDTKRRLLMACFRFTAEQQDSIAKTVGRVLAGPFVEQASLCFLLVKFISQETKCEPESQFVDALMLTLVYYAAESDQKNEQNILVGELRDKLKHRFNGIGNERKAPDQKLFRRIRHFISQLMVAYSAYFLINCLLDCPHHKPRLELFFNSVLIYRITRVLILGEETIRSLCGDLPLIIQVCDSLQAQVQIN